MVSSLELLNNFSTMVHSIRSSNVAVQEVAREMNIPPSVVLRVISDRDSQVAFIRRWLANLCLRSAKNANDWISGDRGWRGKKWLEHDLPNIKKVIGILRSDTMDYEHFTRHLAQVHSIGSVSTELPVISAGNIAGLSLKLMTAFIYPDRVPQSHEAAPVLDNLRAIIDGRVEGFRGIPQDIANIEVTAFFIRSRKRVRL